MSFSAPYQGVPNIHSSSTTLFYYASERLPPVIRTSIKEASADNRFPLPMANPRGRAWQCVDCQFMNHPTKCKLTDIPALRCGRPGCKTMSATSYVWRITEAFTVDRGGPQNIHLDIPIYKQKGSTCGLYACLVVTRLMWKLQFAWTKRSSYCGEPDEDALRQNYRSKYKHTWKKAPNGAPIESIVIDKALRLFLGAGIPLKGLFTGPVPTMTIKTFIQIDHSDVEGMTKLIANGYPLVGGAPMGRLQHLITCEEVYHAPEHVEGLDGHAFALIGSGLGYKQVAGREPVHETYFVARDSAGHCAHPSTKRGKSDRGVGFGGDFLVWSSDVYEAWRIEIVDSYL
ncbi:unnamed protein product [Alopecurus aequalis]